MDLFSRLISPLALSLTLFTLLLLGQPSISSAEDTEQNDLVEKSRMTLNAFLSDWIADARTVFEFINDGPPVTIVGNSLGGWIAWLMAQEYSLVEKLILVAPAFNMMGVRAQSIEPERQQAWHKTGWMPWDDELAYRDFPIAWKWVEESEAYWNTSLARLRPVNTAILHGQQDTVILPRGSSQFVEQVRSLALSFPIQLHVVPGDHRLSRPEHLELFRHLTVGSTDR